MIMIIKMSYAITVLIKKIEGRRLEDKYVPCDLQPKKEPTSCFLLGRWSYNLCCGICFF